MRDFVKSVSGEVNLPLVPDEQLDFTMKLYDLNQVGGAACCCRDRGQLLLLLLLL
jgi:hypothetical protein